MTWRGPPKMANSHPSNGTMASKVKKAVETLRNAIDDYNNVAFLWTGGKEANVIADMLLYAVDGADEKSPVPFITIDTDNHFNKMYEFRDDYTSVTGDEGANTIGPPTGISNHRVVRYEEMLDKVINNPADPRGYHGRYTHPSCPVCEHSLESSDGECDYKCIECGYQHIIPDKFRSALPEEEWGVSNSCGALKTVPMKRLIQDKNFDALITGRRGEDPLTPGNDDTLDHVRDRKTPAPHTRINPLADWEEPNVYAYIKLETVSLCELYTEDMYRHTDSECCTDEDAVGEYGEGGRDPDKRAARGRLEEMGYV